MVEYARKECFDCHGIFPGNLMRRRSETRATSRSVRDFNPFDQDQMKSALSSSRTTYSTSEILLCPTCNSKRRNRAFLKLLIGLALLGTAALVLLRFFDDKKNDQGFAADKISLFDGQFEHSVSYNEDGAILLSSRDKIYLGKSCDVFSKKFGKGVWGQANGGIAIQFRQKRIAFARQSIRIPNVSCEVP